MSELEKRKIFISNNKLYVNHYCRENDINPGEIIYLTLRRAINGLRGKDFSEYSVVFITGGNLSRGELGESWDVSEFLKTRKANFKRIRL